MAVRVVAIGSYTDAYDVDGAGTGINPTIGVDNRIAHLAVAWNAGEK